MFDITKFSAIISKNSPAPLNKFQVFLVPPLAIRNPILDDLPMLCDTVNLPGMSLGSDEFRHKGYGLAEKRPTTFGFDDVTITIIGDSNGKVNELLQAWSNLIFPHDTNEDTGTELFNYPSEYYGTMEIYVYDKAGNITSTYSFQNVYPFNIGGIQLGWEQVDSFMRIPITFTYRNYKLNKKNFGKMNPLQTVEEYNVRINNV